MGTIQARRLWEERKGSHMSASSGNARAARLQTSCNTAVQLEISDYPRGYFSPRESKNPGISFENEKIKTNFAFVYNM